MPSSLRPTDELPESLRGALFTLIDPRAKEFATSDGDKRRLADAAPLSRELVVVWVGKWRSDAFTITAREARRRLA